MIEQDIPVGIVEIIVVDNGSTDLTKTIVHEISSQSPVPILLIPQPIRGCLNTIKMGMEIAVQRFSKISLLKKESLHQ